MAEHQVMSWLPKHHSHKRDFVSHPNAWLQRRRPQALKLRREEYLKKHAIAPSAPSAYRLRRWVDQLVPISAFAKTTIPDSDKVSEILVGS